MFALRFIQIHATPRVILAIAAAVVVSAAGGQAWADNWIPGPIPAVLERVIDGDTIAVRASVWVGVDVDTHVRFADVDAPELFRPRCDAERELGVAARDFIEALELETVILEDVHYGMYAGRVVARVLTPEGRDLSEALMEAGLGAAEGGEEVWCGSDG